MAQVFLSYDREDARQGARHRAGAGESRPFGLVGLAHQGRRPVQQGDRGGAGARRGRGRALVEAFGRERLGARRGRGRARHRPAGAGADRRNADAARLSPVSDNRSVAMEGAGASLTGFSGDAQRRIDSLGGKPSGRASQASPKSRCLGRGLRWILAVFAAAVLIAALVVWRPWSRQIDRPVVAIAAASQSAHARVSRATCLPSSAICMPRKQTP